MARDVTTATAAALQVLRHAVNRYAERMRAAMHAARQDADSVVKRAEDTARRRKADLDRADGELAKARDALARCRDPREAAQLRGELATREHHARERRQLLGYAQQALRIAMDARSDLAKVMQVLDADVGQHSSAASSALASIESKITEIGSTGGLGQYARGTAVTGAMLVNMTLGGADAGHLIQTISNGYESVDGHRATISEMRREKEVRELRELAEGDIAERERHAGEVPKP